MKGLNRGPITWNGNKKNSVDYAVNKPTDCLFNFFVKLQIGIFLGISSPLWGLFETQRIRWKLFFEWRFAFFFFVASKICMFLFFVPWAIECLEKWQKKYCFDTSNRSLTPLWLRAFCKQTWNCSVHFANQWNWPRLDPVGKPNTFHLMKTLHWLRLLFQDCCEKKKKKNGQRDLVGEQYCYETNTVMNQTRSN